MDLYVSPLDIGCIIDMLKVSGILVSHFFNLAQHVMV
jgi:hypothetical protein